MITASLNGIIYRIPFSPIHFRIGSNPLYNESILQDNMYSTNMWYQTGDKLAVIRQQNKFTSQECHGSILEIAGVDYAHSETFTCKRHETANSKKISNNCQKIKTKIITHTHTSEASNYFSISNYQREPSTKWTEKSNALFTFPPPLSCHSLLRQFPANPLMANYSEIMIKTAASGRIKLNKFQWISHNPRTLTMASGSALLWSHTAAHLQQSSFDP